MTTKLTIRDLVTELEGYQKFEDKTLPLLKSFLYSEHYALQLCRENNINTSFNYECGACRNITGSRSLSLTEMIEKLIEKK